MSTVCTDTKTIEKDPNGEVGRHSWGACTLTRVAERSAGPAGGGLVGLQELGCRLWCRERRLEWRGTDLASEAHGVLKYPSGASRGDGKERGGNYIQRNDAWKCFQIYWKTMTGRKLRELQMQRPTNWHILVKMLKIKDKENILKEARTNWCVTRHPKKD